MNEPILQGIAADRADQGRRLIVVVWVFTALVVLLLLFAGYSIQLMSAGRAYVAGEGMWSKAQKQAVIELSRYLVDRNPDAYARYEAAVAVTLGDRQARLELEKPDPDLSLVTRGFLQGRNHPDDIDGMIGLFRSFRRVPEIDRAIAIWAQGDAQIDRLIALGHDIRASVATGGPDDGTSRVFLQRLQAIDRALAPLEDAFSATLGEASRRMQTVLLTLMFGLVSVLLVLAYLFSRRVVGQYARLQRALLDSEDQLRRLLKGAPLPILVVRDADARLAYANDRALLQLGLTPDTLGTHTAPDFYAHPQDRAQVLALLDQHGGVRDHELELQATDGRRFWVLVSAQRIRFENVPCALIALTDIDARKRAQQELHHRAFHDELTGLPNRAMFMDALNRTRHRLERNTGMFAILFVDLDGFKGVNDEHGHRIGDLLLREVALRLRLCVREGDLVARLGGDEFVVLLEGHPDEAAVVARKILAALAPAVTADGLTLHTSASIGISRYPHDGTELGELMRRADAAMYQAKASGRNTYHMGGARS